MKNLSQANIEYLLSLIINAIEDGAESVRVDKATLQQLGIVKPDGSTITINNGVISANLPTVNIATTSAVGIAKPDDDTLIIDSNGTLSLNDNAYTVAELSNMWNIAKNGGNSGS